MPYNTRSPTAAAGVKTLAFDGFLVEPTSGDYAGTAFSDNATRVSARSSYRAWYCCACADDRAQSLIQDI